MALNQEHYFNTGRLLIETSVNKKNSLFVQE